MKDAVRLCGVADHHERGSGSRRGRRWRRRRLNDFGPDNRGTALRGDLDALGGAAFRRVVAIVAGRTLRRSRCAEGSGRTGVAARGRRNCGVGPGGARRAGGGLGAGGKLALRAAGAGGGACVACGLARLALQALIAGAVRARLSKQKQTGKPERVRQ